MLWLGRWRWLRRTWEWPRVVNFFGGPEAFRTQDWTVPADALPEGLAGIRDHESARAFVARHYPIPVEWPGWWCSTSRSASGAPTGHHQPHGGSMLSWPIRARRRGCCSRAPSPTCAGAAGSWRSWLAR